jgi:hypothetical protein
MDDLTFAHLILFNLGVGRYARGDAIEKTERSSTPKRACLFGRHKSARSASFVAMMQTTDVRERDICLWRVVRAENLQARVEEILMRVRDQTCTPIGGLTLGAD